MKTVLSRPVPLYSCGACGAYFHVSPEITDRMTDGHVRDLKTATRELHSRQCLGVQTCPDHVHGVMLPDASHGMKLRCTTNGHGTDTIVHTDRDRIDVLLVDEVPTWREQRW